VDGQGLHGCQGLHGAQIHGQLFGSDGGPPVEHPLLHWLLQGLHIHQIQHGMQGMQGLQSPEPVVVNSCGVVVTGGNVSGAIVGGGVGGDRVGGAIVGGGVGCGHGHLQGLHGNHGMHGLQTGRQEHLL
jgi:hypothetical protein